ncbi:hypothetical protein CWS35_36455 [Bradyrhizobium sp. SK17]|uniref:PAS domain-containing sensor histidine kinase n=1 Tax=Bradyrhizobium sp. SK17 TaxID=2057741 RepID=UPI000C300A24|nr:PAS domain-containing protein [Bradyrhizobium sp. SK17]AUC99129.1 hypothetical protein CWS35_36455 [Bradyrhizobium sp. SK17]
MKRSDLPQPWPPSPTTFYAAAVVSVALAIILAQFLTYLLKAEAIATPLLCAIIFTSWAGGLRPALLAIALALLSFHYYLAPPIDSFVWKDQLYGLDISEIPRLALFLFVSVVVAVVVSAQKRAGQELRRSRDELCVALKDQKRTQAALERSELYLNEAQQLSSTGSFWWNVANGDVIWSDQMFRILGMDQSITPALEFIDQRIHPEDRAAVHAVLDRASRKGTDYDHEYRLLLPDGSVKYVHVAARGQRGASGNIEFVGAMMDVTAVRKAERKLRRSEAYLAEAERLSHTGSWAWDVRGRKFVYRSAEVFNLFGIDLKDDSMSPHPFPDRIAPEDKERVFDSARQAVREKRDLEVDFRITLPDGAIRYIHTIGHPFLGADGEVEQLVGTHVDVTEQRLANEKLQNAFDEIKRSEDHLRLVVDTIPALVWRAGPDGVPDFLNQPALDYTGLKLDQAETGWPRAFHPDDKKGMLQKWTAIQQSGMPGELEARLRRFDGEYRWFLFRAEPLRNRTGNIIKWYGSSTDIEDLKRAEEELRRSKSRLVEAQRVSQTGSFLCNISTGERIGSKEFFRILGFADPRPVTFKMVIQRAHPEDRAFVEQTIKRAFCERRDLDYEHRLLMPDGSVKFVHVVAHASEDRGGQLEYVGAMVDVTATKQAEAELNQAQAELARVMRVTTLGEMTASISHEVNQPLAAVVNAAGACLRWLGGTTPNLDEARQAAQWIIKEGNRAAEVIRRVRALAKNAEPHKEPLDINSIVDDVMALVKRELAARDVRWRLELASAAPVVLADRIQLQQVVINLVMNGVEAMQSISDRPRELIIRSCQNDAQRVVVDVVDSGVGISAEGADKLFNAFYTTKSGGMGMGLSICRSIIEAHGGRLSATNNAGPGAKFQFALPLYKEAP